MPDYTILPSPSFEAALNRLARQYPHASADVHAGLESLKQRPEQGRPMARWRRRVWKLRINSTDIRRGKRYGFRLIYLLEPGVISPLLVYAKTHKEDVSDREVARILRDMGKL